MWTMKIFLLASFCSLMNSYAGPKDFGLKVYRHVIEVTEIGLETPISYPMPLDDEELVARGSLKYKTLH